MIIIVDLILIPWRVYVLQNTRGNCDHVWKWFDDRKKERKLAINVTLVDHVPIL